HDLIFATSSAKMSSLAKMSNGAPGEIRTPDPQIRSLVLYPAELRARRVLAIGFAAYWQAQGAPAGRQGSEREVQGERPLSPLESPPGWPAGGARFFLASALARKPWRNPKMRK